MLHLLAGVDNATSGQIIINGKDITRLDEETLAVFRRREVGIIYQFFNLVPVLTARENIELPMMLDEKPVNKAYFNEIVELLGIEKRLDFYPGKLSGGEQQRVAIARALIHQPSIILADEPTGNLNSKMAHEIMEFLVLACKKYNQTIVMITHDLNLAGYADRIIEIQDGMIVKDYQTDGSKTRVEETDLKAVDKAAILNKAEEKMQSVLYNPIINEEKEGYQANSDQYVMDHEQWLQGLISMYNVDLRLKEETEISQGMARYYQMLKEAMEKNKTIEMVNMRRNRVIERITNEEELIKYIEELEKKRLMTTSRKKALLAYLGKGEDA